MAVYLETNGYTIDPVDIPDTPLENGAGGNAPAMFTIPYLFDATASTQNYSVIYAENVAPVVGADQTLTIACGLTDLANIFKYSVAPIGTRPAPTRLTFAPNLLGITISGWATVPTIIDDAGTSVLTPYGVIQSILAVGAGGDSLPAGINCIQDVVNNGTTIEDVFSPAIVDVVSTNALVPVWCNNAALPAVVSDISRGEAVYALFEQLAGNGRISSSTKSAMMSPDYYLGDGLQYFVNYAVTVNVGYQWTTTFADGGFSTINNTDFALSDFCQNDFNTGVVFWVFDTSYTLTNTNSISNVIYKVNIVSVSTG